MEHAFDVNKWLKQVELPNSHHSCTPWFKATILYMVPCGPAQLSSTPQGETRYRYFSLRKLKRFSRMHPYRTDLYQLSVSNVHTTNSWIETAFILRPKRPRIPSLTLSPSPYVSVCPSLSIFVSLSVTCMYTRPWSRLFCTSDLSSR